MPIQEWIDTVKAKGPIKLGKAGPGDQRLHELRPGSRTAAFGSGAATLGVFFEPVPRKAARHQALAYNSIAFTRAAAQRRITPAISASDVFRRHQAADHPARSPPPPKWAGPSTSWSTRSLRHAHPREDRRRLPQIGAEALGRQQRPSIRTRVAYRR